MKKKTKNQAQQQQSQSQHLQRQPQPQQRRHQEVNSELPNSHHQSRQNHHRSARSQSRNRSSNNNEFGLEKLETTKFTQPPGEAVQSDTRQVQSIEDSIHNRAFDNNTSIVCTIGQKIPESILTYQLLQQETKQQQEYNMSNKNTSNINPLAIGPSCTINNNNPGICGSDDDNSIIIIPGGGDNNYYEKLYEIDLNSSSSRSRSSSTTSACDEQPGHGGSSCDVKNKQDNNVVTCSISSSVKWSGTDNGQCSSSNNSNNNKNNKNSTNACIHGSGGNGDASGTNVQQYDYDYAEVPLCCIQDSRVGKICGRKDPNQQQRSCDCQLTHYNQFNNKRFSCLIPPSPRQILHAQQIPIPPLSILNADGSIKVATASENELDSLDLTLFEKRVVKPPEVLYENINSIESNYNNEHHHHHHHGSLSPASILRAASKKYHHAIHGSGGTQGHGHGHGVSSSNYWLDAGNEFEFISAASVLNNQNKNKQEQLTHKCQHDGGGLVLGHGKLNPSINNSCSSSKSHYCTPTNNSSVLVNSNINPNSTTNTITSQSSNISHQIQNTIMEEDNIYYDDEKPVTLRSASNSISFDTSYDKAICSVSPMSIQQQQQFNKRRGSLPLSMTAGVSHDPVNENHGQNQTSNSSSLSSTSRLVNFFAKRSFKVPSGNQLLNRAKSANKLDTKITVNSSVTGSNSRLHESGENRRNSHIPSLSTNTATSTSSTSSSPPAQLVNAQSLHPSVINNQHGFMTTSSDGSTQYYSCKTRSERDTWLHAIQQSIHHPEKSRVENSFHIWILEGKDVGKPSGGASKRYHCEIYLDDKLVGRTNGKIKEELLFWGEEFIFNEITGNEDTELIVSVWRKESSGKKSGSKRKKEKKKELIGTVKFPLKSLQSRHLVEKWYPLVLETPSTKLKPSLRLKCKYESIQILPMSTYQALLEYVEGNYKLLCEHLEPILSVKAKEDLADAFINVLHAQSTAKNFVADLALGEILKGGDDKLTFRGNSIATKSMESYLKLLGSNYLESTLGPLVEQFQNTDLYECEVDPMRIGQITHLARNQANLRMCVDNIWRSILGAIDVFPIELKECFSYCRQELKNVGREELTGHLISASVFLRYLCPAILSPSLFHITTEYPNEKAARNLMLIAKVLQTLANFTRFQGKESYMEFINDYVEKEAETMANFLLKISASKQTQVVTPSLTTVDLGKWLSILATLLSESIEKIVTKNEKFKTLEEILKKLKTTPLQQQSSTTSCPAPTTSPPPLPAMPPAAHRISSHQGTPAYAIGNIISQTAIPVHVIQHFRSSGQSPEPQTNSSGYQSQSPVLNSYDSSTPPLNFSNPGFATRNMAGVGINVDKTIVDLNQQQRLTPITKRFSSSSCSGEDDDDDDSYPKIRTSSNRPTPSRLRPTTNPLLKSQQHFKSTAALELHRGSHPVHSSSSVHHNNLSSSDSDSGIAAQSSNRGRKIRYTNRRSPDGCQEPVETKTLEEYENEMIELRTAMEILQTKLNRAEERLFGGAHPQQAFVRPRSSTVTNPADILLASQQIQQDKRLSTASARGLEMEDLLQRLLSAEEEMKREQELLSALDHKQKLIDAQEQKITHLDTVNTQLITALSKIHSSLQQQQVKPDLSRPKNSLPSSPSRTNDIVNNNSTIVTITTEGGQPESTSVINSSSEEIRRSMSPDSLNGGLPSISTVIDPNRVVIGEQELLLLADLKSSSC